MTIALSYLTDLSRVRIALSGLQDGTVLVERSANQTIWSTVRGGVALPISGGAGQVDDYEFYADVVNYYRVTPVDPPAGLLLTDQDGDTASTPDTGVLDVTNELDLRIDLQLDDWDPGGNVYLLTKYDFSANQRSYALRISFAGEIQALISSNGSGFNTADSGVEASSLVEDGERIALRVVIDVDNSTGDYTATFYWADTIGGAWTQFGTDTGTLGGTALFNSTAPLVVGAAGDGSSPSGPGTVFAAQVRDGSTVVADVDFAAQTDGDTSFVDDAGLTWTVNNNALIVGTTLEAGNITPSLAGQVWLKSIWFPSQNRTLYRVLDHQRGIDRGARGGMHYVEGRSAPTSAVDARASRQFLLTVQVEDQDAADEMDRILAAGKVFFLHAASTLAGKVPEGYVVIADSVQRRPSTNNRWTFDLPCTVVQPPGPDVVGATMTVGQLVAIHGTVEAVWAAYPDIRALWDSIGSLDDLVV